MHPASLPDDALLKQCDLTKGRAGGPGGQHRNKVETKVTLHHTPTGTASHAGERRSVVDNTRVAVVRLRLALAVDVRCVVPAGDARSDLWKSRTRGGQIVCSPTHRDFPSLLAEALDMIHACNMDTHKAAIRLECSHSQLVKLLKVHPPAFVSVNESRRERGLHILK